MGSGLTASRSAMFSHFMAKLVTKLDALGSAIMRVTCLSNAPGLVNPPAAASVSSGSSGPVFHRKKERREANSRSVRASNRPIEELRAGQDRRHDLLDSQIEASAVFT